MDIGKIIKNLRDLVAIANDLPYLEDEDIEDALEDINAYGEQLENLISQLSIKNTEIKVSSFSDEKGMEHNCI
jgi:hypothetical protein